MKFEFDSNNVNELRAVEAAVAVLLDRLPGAEQAIQFEVDKRAVQDAALGSVGRVLSSDEPLVAAVIQAQEDMMVHGTSTEPPVGLFNAEAQACPQPQGESVPSPELDSAGQPWNPELHSSSRAKVADGTWKKKRGAGKVAEVRELNGLPTTETVAKVLENVAPTPPVPPVSAPVTPPAPPVPAVPAPTSAEGKIWALISGGVVTVNQALEAARAAGLADLGVLRQADEAKKLEVLRVLEGE